jgi:hypothetical protein
VVGGERRRRRGFELTRRVFADEVLGQYRRGQPRLQLRKNPVSNVQKRLTAGGWGACKSALIT